MADTTRMKALQKLSGQMPVASQSTAQGLQSARDIQFRQSIGTAPQGAGVGAARQLGTQNAAASGQQTIAQAQQGLQNQQNLGQLALGEQQMQQTGQIAGQELSLEQHREKLASKLASISEEATRKVFDSRMEFQVDEMNRTHFNERQLADFAVMQARNKEDLAKWEQESHHAHKRKIQLLETMHKKVLAAMQEEFAKSEQSKSQDQIQLLKQMEKDMAEKIRKEKQEAANKGGMWSAAGTVVGTVIGAYVGGPAGASAGGKIGGAAGEAGAANT